MRQGRNRLYPRLKWADNKDVLPEYHWLLKLLSRGSHKSGNDGYKSPFEGKRLEGKKREKNIACFNVVGTLLVDGELNDLVPLVLLVHSTSYGASVMSYMKYHLWSKIKCCL